MTAAPLEAFDAGVDALLRVARHLPVLDPVQRGLAAHRRQVGRSIAERLRPMVRPLEKRVVAGESEAVERYDGLLGHAMREMREARPEGLRAGLLGGLDRLVYRDAPELLDDPSFPREQRVHVLASLDRLNEAFGAYERWAGLLEPDLRESEGAGPLEIHDLAAGHGGFALALKERLGGRVRVTASDISDEYLDIGREAARRRGLEVGFVRQDATRLGSLEGPEVDVFLCTQSLHHFPPGMVARMLGEAARKARRAVLFIDAERGLVPALLVGSAMAAVGRAWPVVHDTVVSLRRMYFEEELLLLARLAPQMPERARVSSGRLAPGYAFLRVDLG